jgi:hypothetical protein
MMELRKIGLLYTGIALVLASVMGYSISVVSPDIKFLTMFASLFLVLLLMKFVTLFLIKTFIVEKIVALKDEVKRFNFTKKEQLPHKYENSCLIGELAKNSFEFQNRSLETVQTLERELEQKNDMLRENQYYIEHLESAILKSKTGEDDGV